jgi:pimeloyl-ACP methyl ester carboxylesterase
MTAKKKKARSHATDLRAASKLAIDATKRVTSIVEAMHHAIGGTPARIFSAPTYATIRGVTHVVGSGIDFALARLAPLLGESAPGSDREAVRAALNGVIGDYLEKTKNALAIEMRLAPHGRKRARIIVFVHGSSMNGAQWTRERHDHGRALARKLRVTPVYVDYNSGRRIEDNGRELAERIAKLASSWPVEIESIAIVGHSMGGLVARSAARHGVRRLDRVVTLGTPHFGAPLERAGAMIEMALGVTPYSAPLAALARVRGAGIVDLRRGTREKMPEAVALYAIAGGADKLVPQKSALGPADAANRFVASGVGHLDLLSSAIVYEALERFLMA